MATNREVVENFCAVLVAGIVNDHTFDARRAHAAVRDAAEIFISKYSYLLYSVEEKPGRDVPIQ